MGEISYGSYTSIQKQNDYLVKHIFLDKLSPNQKIILKDIQQSVNDIEKYQQILINNNYPVVPAYDFEYYENTIKFKQKYIESLNIDEILEQCYQTNQYQKVFKIFEDVFDLWVFSHQSEEYFVDYNLRNFVYKNGKLVLIDIYPPLIAQNIKSPSNSASKNQIALWCNKYINLASLICYFVQGIVQKGINNQNIKMLNKTMDYIFETMNKKAGINKLEFIENVKNINHVFAKRFENLLDICENKNKNINEFIDAILF